MNEYITAKLGGRCANGYERGQGVRIHAHTAVLMLSTNQYVTSAALCGITPGPRSVGWTYHPGLRAVTCPKCLRALARTPMQEWQP